MDEAKQQSYERVLEIHKRSVLSAQSASAIAAKYLQQLWQNLDSPMGEAPPQTVTKNFRKSLKLLTIAVFEVLIHPPITTDGAGAVSLAIDRTTPVDVVKDLTQIVAHAAKVYPWVESIIKSEMHVTPQPELE